MSVELGFWIPIVSRIPDSLCCIPDSKMHKENFHGLRNPDSYISGCMGRGVGGNEGQNSDAREDLFSSHHLFASSAMLSWVGLPNGYL